MARIARFEDVDAWQKARKLAGQIYAASKDGAFSRDFGLRDQIRRAVVSVMANIAEGFERRGGVEFRRFLGMAKGSAGELKSHLYVALDAGYIKQEQFDRCYEDASETGGKIGGLMRYLSAACSDTRHVTRDDYRRTSTPFFRRKSFTTLTGYES